MDQVATSETTAPQRSRTYGQWWDWKGDYIRADIADVRALGRAMYRTVGASVADAEYLFDNLFDKTLQGDHSRGLVYLPGLISDVQSGHFDISPTVRVVREKGATAVVDGGPVSSARPNDLVCRAAMDYAIGKARDFGIGIVGAQAAPRLMTPLVTTAIQAGMIGIVFTQGPPQVAPIGGFEPLLGNAPTAIGIPAGRRDPVILDMSMTETSSSPVLLAATQGQEIPAGLILDRFGNETTDARAYFGGDLTNTVGHVAVQGTLAPLANNHKGYALLFAVGLLAQVLTDTSPSWDLAAGAETGGRFGSVNMAIDPASFSLSGSTDMVDRFLDVVTSAPAREDGRPVLYPGQRSQELKRQVIASGVVEVPDAHLVAFCELATGLGLALPASLQGV